tara:strand:+ start:2914 stop:4689 length:1776 start_codon:yes stop_codon:yes gene_type:complete
MRNLAYGLLITIGILIGFDYALKAEEVTTGNLLNNSTFGSGTSYDTTGWTISSGTSGHSNMSAGGGNNPGGSVAAIGNTNIEQTINSLSTAAEMTVNEIRKGWSSKLSTDIWYWNSYDNTTTLKQTITDNEGNVTTQQRVIPNTGCGYINCGQYTNYTDTHIQGTNTKDDFSIKVGVSNSNNRTGHWGPDIDDIQLVVTYTDVPPIDDTTQEELEDITEDIEQDIPNFETIEEDFAFEEDFSWEDEYFTWEEDFYFEEDFSIADDYMVGDWEMDYEMEFNDDMYFEMEEEFVEMEMPEAFEEFDMTMMPEDSFEDMYMEEFEEFETFEDAFMETPEEFEEMEMTEEFEEMEMFDTAMEMEEEFVEMEAPEEFTEMEMEEEFEEVAEMEEEFEEMEAVEEEETVDMGVEEEEDVVEMGEENEETEVVENEESMENTEEGTDESETEVAEESESEDSPQEVVENEEETVGKDDIRGGEVVDNRVTVSKDIKIGKIEVGEIKVAVNPRDIFKETVNLDTYSEKDFYKDPGLNYAVNDEFFDQLSMIEYNKEIYNNVTLVAYIQGDPIAAHRREMEELAIQKTGIMIELKLLRGE